jgi:hypothetical protein
MKRSMPRGPLALIGAPAAVAVWSGWVGLGGLCGFGPIHPLPGIAGGFTLNTAITLPVGIESYGAFALAAWIRSAEGPARTFARRSALGALALGMLGQVAFHLLVSAHAHRAPVPVIIFVSCLPVMTLGFGTALAHLLRDAEPGGGDPDPGKGTRPALANGYPLGPDAIEVPPGTAIRITPGVPEPVFAEREVPEVPAEVPAPVSAGSPETAPAEEDGPAPPALLPAEPSEALSAAEAFYMPGLAAGRVPGVKRIRADLHVGQARATAIRDHLKSVAAGTPGTRPELRVVRGGAR